MEAPLGGWVHRLSEVDKIAKTATCANCGPVKIGRSGAKFRCRVVLDEGRSKNLDRRRSKGRAKLDEIKNVPCMDCGGRFPPFVMDFDHRDPKEKSFGIGQSPGRSWVAIEAEVAKCDIVCANCHRIRTFNRDS